MRKILYLVALWALWAVPAGAQTQGQAQGYLRGLATPTTADTNCVVLPAAGMGTGAATLVGTWAGTVTFYVGNTGDPADYSTMNVRPPNSSTEVTSTTTTGTWSGSVAGYRYFRVCMSLYTSGTAGVLLSTAATGGGGGTGGSSGVVSQGSTTSGQSGMLSQGAVSTAAPSYTNAQTSPISLTTAGSVRVDVMNGGGGGTSAIDDADFVDSTTVFTLAGCVAEAASPTTVTEGDMGACAMTLNRAVKVTLFDTAGNPLTPGTDYTEDAVVSDANTGPAILGRRIDVPASSAGTSGDYALFNLNATGSLYTIPGGALAYYRTSAGSTEDEHEVKATAGVLYSVLVTNTNASARYIRCYNLTAANTTPGTSTVFWGAAIPGATTGAGFAYSFPGGLYFDTALTCAYTTGAADTDVAEVAANEIKGTYSYR